MPDYQIAQERMLFNADKSELLPEGHKDGAFLYASEGTRIPADVCEKHGIKDGKLSGSSKAAPVKKAPAKKAPAKKPAAKPADKEKAPAENKGGDA